MGWEDPETALGDAGERRANDDVTFADEAGLREVGWFPKRVDDEKPPL